MAYADFTFYNERFLGHLITDSETFSAMAERASEHVDLVTFCRINTDTLKNGDVADSVKRCTCALAEVYYLQSTLTNNATSGTGAKLSEKVGEYSVSWADPADSLQSLTDGNFSSYIRGLCRKYLAHTGLMFRGIPY